MKVRDTSQGRMYAISSEIGCTAINGAMAIDIPAGGQSVILALDKKIVIDGDDDAKFVEVRWGTNAAVGSRSIPWMSDVVDGLVSIVGVDKLDINYIPAENKLVVHTDRVSDELSEEVTELLSRVLPQNIEVARYNHHIEVSWRDIDRFADCVYSSDVLAAAPNGSLGELVTSDGWWVYTLPKCDDAHGFVYKGNAPTIASRLKHLIVDGQLFGRYGGYWVSQSSCFGYSYILESVKLTNYKPTYMHNWFEHCKKLSHVDIDYSEMNTARVRFGAIFYNCILDKWSVLRIDETLPVKHASAQAGFTIGIHVDHQNDDEVLAAIANFESKGWELAVQWNGTPTAQAATTYGLRKPPIYARVSEHELPDGTTERFLDWGHYVTNWEERGYEQFRSLESAYEYFNLPMPEVETEEELQIEEIENA